MSEIVTTIISGLNTTGVDLVTWIVAMNAWMAALVVAALLLDRLLARRVAATWRLALYAAIAVRLVLPVTWNSPFAIPTPHAPPGVAAPFSAWLAPTGTTPVDAAPARPGATLASAPRPVLTWRGAVVLTYGAGVTLLLAGWCLARARLALGARDARPVRVADQSEGTPIFESPTLGPALVGLIRPRIVLPADLCAAAGASEVAWIVAHERAHLARRDHLVAAAWQLATIAAWPILAVWVAAWRSRQLMEIACDERALRGCTGAARRQYGELLLRLVDGAPPRRLANVGLLGRAPVGLRERLRALARPVRSWPGVAQAALVVAISALLVACATGGSHPTGRPAGPPAAAATGPDRHNGITNQVLVTVHVIENAPGDPNLAFALGQRHVDAEDAPPPPDANQMTEKELEAFLHRVAEDANASIISAPRIVVSSGRRAWVRIGNDDENGEPIDGLRLEVTPQVNVDGTITLDIDYEAYGLEVRAPASDFDDGDEIGLHDLTFTIRPNRTQFALATGYIGAPRHLVAISASVIDAQGIGAAPAPPAPAPRAPGALSHVEYYAVFWDTSIEPPIADLLPGARRVAYDLDDGGVAWLDVVSGASTRPLIEWWRGNAFFNLGGKDGARLDASGAWVQYDLAKVNDLDGADIRQLRLRMSGTVEPDGVHTTIHWFELSPEWRSPKRRFASRIELAPDDELILTMPVAEDTWRMVLVRARAADPNVFRGQTAVGGITPEPPAPPAPPATSGSGRSP